MGMLATSFALRSAGGLELRYRLVERTADGGFMVEEFTAPSDEIALERALDVAEGGAIELWRGERLILGDRVSV